MENKHYIRVDGQGNIILWFSDAFEQPQDGDICIHESGGRQFELNGKTNPPRTTPEGICLFRWDGSAVIAKSDTEIEAERAALPAPDSDPLSTLAAENTLLKAQVQALTDRGEFVEDCIAELAMQVYA